MRSPAQASDDRAAREAARRAEAEAVLRRMATEDVPESHTVEAIERGVPQGELAPAVAPPASDDRPDRGYARLGALPLDAIRLSPFQPKGRPSEEALREVTSAIARVGGLDVLLEPAGDEQFQRLRAESKRLAELAFSILRDGVRDPIEVREAEDGQAECLSGHRRLAAAALAGLTQVPVLHRGALTAAQAAKTVLEGNLHRENFTPWQEAVVVTAVYDQRRREHKAHDVRTIGQLMGWSHGKTGLFLQIRRMLSPRVVEQIGEGDASRADVALSRVESVAALARLAKIEDEDRRVEMAQRVLGFTANVPAPVVPSDQAFVYRPKRTGGFLLDVPTPAESLPLDEAERLLDLLTMSVGRVQARIAHLRTQRR